MKKPSRFQRLKWWFEEFPRKSRIGHDKRCYLGIHKPFFQWNDYYTDGWWRCDYCGHQLKEPYRNRVLDKISEFLGKLYIQ